MKKRYRNLFITLIFAFGALCAVLFAPTAKANAEESEGGAREVASYFTANALATLRPDFDTPEYVAEKRNSLLVESQAGGKVEYDNIIDVSETTKDDLLFEIQPMPQTVGVPEMTRMIVRMEDAENPKIFVNISLRRYTFSDGAPITHVLVQPNTVQSYYGFMYDKMHAFGVVNNIQWGTMIIAQWKGADRGYSNGIKIYYDNAEHAIYAGEQPNHFTEYQDDKNRLLVLDMDTPLHMGADKTKLWNGFPSNKVKISFSATELVEERARYMIYNIDGQSFDGKTLNDKTAPKLSVDSSPYADDALPEAVVGKFYPFFSARANDKIDGEVPVKVRVYKEGKEIFHTGKGFTPDSAGEYVLKYVASDGSLNTQSKSYTVQAAATAPEFDTEFAVKDGCLDLTDESLKNADGSFNANLFYPIKLPELKVFGNKSGAAADISVYYGNQALEVVDGVVTPKWTGFYDVLYTITDFSENVKILEYTLKAEYGSLPSLKKPILPDEALTDKSMYLPKAETEFYTVWGQKVKTQDVITVYKADGITVLQKFDGGVANSYSPKATDGEKIVVEYLTRKDGDSPEAVYRKEIRLIPSAKLSDRFVYGENVELTEDVLSLDFGFTAEGEEVRYVNKLSVFDELKVEFIVPPEKNGYDEVCFTITDSVDESVTMTVNIYKNPDDRSSVSYIALNGKRESASEISASFYGNVSSVFLFSLAQNGDVSHSDLGFEKAPDGFKGFASGFVYLKMSARGLENGEKEAVVSFARIKNQILGEQEYDFMKPILKVGEMPSGIADLGSYINIPGAVASDVYDEQVFVGLEVKFANKTVFRTENPFGNIDGAAIFASDYGVYSLTYTAVDATGNKTVKRYSIRVKDKVAPSLTVNGEVPKTFKAGEKLTLPTVTAKDNVDVEVKVYAIIVNPMNEYAVIAVGEEYLPSLKGRYVVHFYCEDKSYNQSVSGFYHFTVE